MVIGQNSPGRLYRRRWIENAIEKPLVDHHPDAFGAAVQELSRPFHFASQQQREIRSRLHFPLAPASAVKSGCLWPDLALAEVGFPGRDLDRD